MQFIIVLAFTISMLVSPPFAQASPKEKSYKGNEPNVVNDQQRILMGSPLDVGATIEENARTKKSVFKLPAVDSSLETWFNWKEQLKQKYGFKLGVDYQALYLNATESLEEDEAAGGAFRLFGDWTVLGRGSNHPGSIVFKVENRHRLGTDVDPESLGFVLGYNGIVGTGYSGFEWGTTDLYWKQQFWGDHPVEFRLGRIAPTAFFDGTVSSDPYTTFLNFSLLFTPTVAYPADGSMGAALWVGVTDKLYALGTVMDANSSTTKSGFDTIDEKEFFTGFEFGWADRGAASSFVDNLHVSLWHADARTDADVPESWGIGVTGSWLFYDDRLMPFVRLGWSDDGAALLEKSVALGFGINLTERSDLLGIGMHWGQPFAPNDRDQYVSEVFYRLQLAKNLAITPDVQLLIDPALNPEEDTIWVFGLRARLTL